MAIRLKLGSYDQQTDDPLGRAYIGYFPRMTEAEAWEAGRGVWKVDVDKVHRQRFAVIVGEKLIRAVAEITGATSYDTATGPRVALEGELLPEGHPVREAYLGKSDPIVNGSQNPIGYCELPEELPFLHRACACGCGTMGARDFQPGHDIRAINERIRTRFGGSALKFLQWVDGAMDSAAVQGDTKSA